MAPIEPLSKVPLGADLFIDANIFVYGLSRQSKQCFDLLDRCSKEEVTGVCLFEIVNEATHRFMLAEAKSKGLIAKETASQLRARFNLIPGLTDYWRRTERILSLNMIFFASDEFVVREANAERQGACLLTNDSMIVACMRKYGISSLATNDRDFERVAGIRVYRPDDLRP